MRYSDEELYQKTTVELINLEEKMNVRQFRKWSIFRFKSLINQATFYVKDWNRYDIKSLREYRIKSMSHYQSKCK